MKPKRKDSNRYSILKDAAVFCATVLACTFMLTVACAFNKPADRVAAPLPELVTPRQPQLLALLAVPEPVQAQVEPSMAADESEGAVATAKDEAVQTPTEAIAVVSSALDGALPKESIPYHGIIIQVAGRYAVDPHLVRAIIFAESGFNPKAISKKGARGLMQLMPSTAKALGVQNVYDPQENIEGGVRYFRSLLDRFDGDVQLALAAYNAGSRHVRNYEGIPPFKATRHYIKKVLKFHEKYKMQAAAGFRRLA